MHIQQFSFNAFQTRCCVVWDEDGHCAFIDPGCASHSEISQITDFVSQRGLKPVCIMLTHAHFDHIYGMSALAKEFGIPVYAHIGEMFTIEKTNPEVCRCYGLPLPDLFPLVVEAEGRDLPSKFLSVSDGSVIEVGTLHFHVIETPGHSRGGLCFYAPAERVLFSGDTLFAGAIGRTDHPGGDYELLMHSINDKLLPLDDLHAPAPSDSPAPRHTSVTVIPGHGPCTDLATEGMTNPFLQPFNLPYDD
jgi:glyoxylase-like metal-dependent hydrolase (beta-lactamase superfamily II)